MEISVCNPWNVSTGPNTGDDCFMSYLKLLLVLPIRSTTHINAGASSSSPTLWYTKVVMHSHTTAAPIASSIRGFAFSNVL